jgi:chloramphenicol O-acetyltransferase type A
MKPKTLNLATWNRKEHFEFFCRFEEPFFGVTTPIDCTIAYNEAKKANIPFFIYYLHKTLIAINEIENFRYRISGDEVLIYETIDASATIMREDKTFGFSLIPFYQNLSEFTKYALQEINRVQTTTGLFTRDFQENLIHFSALPWVNFTGITHSRSFTFPDSCPKISMGKIVTENNKKTMAMALFVHHGLMDGYHVGLFVERFQELMNVKTEN